MFALSLNATNGAGIGGGNSGTGTVKIYGGTVTVTNNSFGASGAGIGGGQNGAGDVEIRGGTVTAEGSSNGAAIGGGMGADGIVKISGGKVSAVSKDGAAAAIGGGGKNSSKQSGGANITISGGVIDASADYGTPIGSGCGYNSSPREAVVTISGGTITTSCTQDSDGTEIGARSGNGAATVTITGGNPL